MACLAETVFVKKDLFHCHGVCGVRGNDGAHALTNVQETAIKRERFVCSEALREAHLVFVCALLYHSDPYAVVAGINSDDNHKGRKGQ